jgi:hypothetical protein
MARCRSWRYNTRSGDFNTLPGEDRAVWTLCTNKVPRGFRRCDECLNALLFHPNEQVRVALAKEKGASRATLELLANDDPSMVVSSEAEKALARLEKSPRRNARATDIVSDTTKHKLHERKNGSSGLWADSPSMGMDAFGEKVENGEEPLIVPARPDGLDIALGTEGMSPKSN